MAIFHFLGTTLQHRFWGFGRSVFKFWSFGGLFYCILGVLDDGFLGFGVLGFGVLGFWCCGGFGVLVVWGLG